MDKVANMSQSSTIIALDQWSARVVFSISRREWEFLRFNLVHRDETENSWHLLSGFETRLRKYSSNLGHRDEIEIYYLHSQTSRREREFPWSDLVFRDETENSETCHLSLKSGLYGLTILHAIFGRLTILNAGPHILLDLLPFWNDPVMFFVQVYCDFFDCCHKWHNIVFWVIWFTNRVFWVTNISIPPHCNAA